ncbi:MAG: hypothetical protein K6E33_00550, partial [Lachnospiraceae bacterium]|nr:hypothetical protein [Lachnospiraceae bacterium]
MVDSASFSLGVAIRATFLMFTFEMDAVAIKGSYTYSTDKWKWAYTVFGKDHPISAAGTGGEGGDSLLQLPHDVSKTQTIYSSQTGTAQGREGELSPVQAYDPGDSNVPFQLSGYNSQCDALLLADGLDLSYDYKVVTVDNENYVVYMMGRPGGTGMDTSMLAVSRLVTTDEGDGKVTENSNAGEGENKDGLGLVNPLDWETVEVTDSETGVTYEYKAVKAPGERSDTNYILVDLKEEKGSLVDDGTGDLEFDVSVSGSTINVAWVSYAKTNSSPSSDARKAFQDAAKNTVVKQASYDTSKKEGFSKAVTLNTAGHAVYNPTIIDDTHTAFVKANHVTPAKRTTLLSAYGEKLNSFGYYKESENDSNKNIFDFRMESYENIIDYKGGSSDLCIYSFKTKKLTEFSNMGGSTSGYASSEKTPVIDKLEGIPAADDSSAFYVAYTVWDEDLTNEDKQKDGQHNSALYIADLEQGTSVVTSRYGQHKLVSDHLKGTDGAGEHKMIDTLDFFHKENYQDVNHVLDDDVLIVGQGENLYTMEYANLETCLVGKGSMETEPLTATSFYGGEIEENSRSEFTFGEDADGNLVTVYVGSMKDTTNTALFLSTYDGESKEWGKGVILAMRHMDVYEDAAKNGWTHEETEKAYLGNRTGYDRGGMDQFQFCNPQIALGVKTAEEGGTAEGEATTTGFDRFGTSLVILTGGMMRYLTTETGPDGEKVVTPGTAPEGAVPKEGKGIYAVCYGVGHHSIGHGNITFTSENFSAGSELSAGISFINTGDVSIRGSEDNPITVTLNAVGDELISKTLATWSVKENIRSGQEVQLHGIFTLPVTLPKGAEFSIAVSEDASYAEDPFSATLKGLYAIDEKAELGFEDCSIDLSRQDNGKLTLDDKGNAVLDVDLYVGNRGIKDVDDAYLQFSYGIYDPLLASKVEASEGGESSWSDTIFNALDITDHSLTVGDEEELPALTAVGGTENNDKEGILSLGRLRAGYGRHVRGTITVSAEEFAYFDETAINDPAGSLKIAVEIYDSSD